MYVFFSAFSHLQFRIRMFQHILHRTSLWRVAAPTLFVPTILSRKSSACEEDIKNTQNHIVNHGEKLQFHQPSQMLVADMDTFCRKWNKFANDGLDQLLVVTDFDYTLTPYRKPDGSRGESSHGLLMTSSVLPIEAQKLARSHFAEYYPIEHSPVLSNKEKLPFIIEWWTKEHNLLIKHGLTKEKLKLAVHESEMNLRNSAFTMLEKLAKANVPVLIFSAGLYDVIHAILDKLYMKKINEKPPSNIHVISNMMEFNSTGELIQFQGNLMHSLNKNASLIVHTPFWKQCKAESRRNILVFGDTITDADMVYGLNHTEDEILRIGFLNNGEENVEKLSLYLNTFDVVLIGDATFDVALLLLDSIQQQSSMKVSKEMNK